MVKHLPTMRETWVWSLGWEDPLEKEIATHPSILAWKIPWTEEPGRLQSVGSQSRTRLSNFTFTFFHQSSPLAFYLSLSSIFTVSNCLTSSCVFVTQLCPTPCDFMDCSLPGSSVHGILQARIHWKDWCWSWSSNTLATWGEEPTYWKRPWCWERLKAGWEEGDRGWDGWMASLTQWTWVWANFRK